MSRSETPMRAGASASAGARVSVTGRPGNNEPGASLGKPGPTTEMPGRPRPGHPQPAAGGPAGAQVTPGEGLGGGVTRAAGAAAPRPADDQLVWVATRRRGIPAHRPDGALTTVCGRSMRTGERLLAGVARAAYHAVWCERCWPEVA